MEQSISSGHPKRMQGALMIVGAVAVGVGSGLVLNLFLPDHQDPMSAAQHTQQAESENAESSDAAESAPPPVAEAPAQEEPAPAAEASVAQSALEPAEETASVETPSEQAAEPQAASPSESSDYSAQASSSDAAAMPEPETRESRAPVAAERQAPRGQTTVSSANRANRSAPPPAAQVLRPWWAPTSTDPFGIQYVGQVEGQRAVAILFSADIGNAGEIDKALKLIDESGQAVSGGWKVGNNPRLAVRSDLKQGRYTLAIDGQLASASGQNLRTPLRGPVYIQ